MERDTVTLDLEHAQEIYMVGAMGLFALAGRISPGVAITALLAFGIDLEMARQSLSAFSEMLDIEAMPPDEAHDVFDSLVPVAQQLGLEPPPKPAFGELS